MALTKAAMAHAISDTMTLVKPRLSNGGSSVVAILLLRLISLADRVLRCRFIWEGGDESHLTPNPLYHRHSCLGRIWTRHEAFSATRCRSFTTLRGFFIILSG